MSQHHNIRRPDVLCVLMMFFTSNMGDRQTPSSWVRVPTTTNRYTKTRWSFTKTLSVSAIEEMKIPLITPWFMDKRIASWIKQCHWAARGLNHVSKTAHYHDGGKRVFYNADSLSLSWTNGGSNLYRKAETNVKGPKHRVFP